MRAIKQHHSTVYKFMERKRLHGRYWHNFVQCRLSKNGLHDFSIVLLAGSCFNYWQRISNLEGCLTVHLLHEIMWNAILMQWGNFIDVFLALHASGAYHPSTYSVQKTICRNSTSHAPDDAHMCPKTCRAKNTSIKLPRYIKLAFHIIS